MIACKVPAQGAHGALIGAGRAANAQINAAGIEGRERSKLLGNYQRRMVW